MKHLYIAFTAILFFGCSQKISTTNLAKRTNVNSDRWQQHVSYTMEIDMDVENHTYDGHQSLIYTNNSPETLHKVYYHLYFNAFQPGSMMDVRSRTIEDPDGRVGDRISKLKPNEIGYQKIQSLTQNGKKVRYEEIGTVLEVSLSKPILPGEKATFVMDYKAQIPLQIRRSGRNNKEGIDYSMTQWYPKMCEYDYQGWHANPYVGREFYGVWGDFDVTINIDKKYIIGGTGYLKNPLQVGKGYTKSSDILTLPDGDKLKWHFWAPNVHDFAWGADPDYTHTMRTTKSGVDMHFFYQKNEKTEKNWAELPGVMEKALDFVESKCGKYDYKQYSFVQGGDGGMEYPMTTLITAERKMSSLVGVSVHEWLHSWYQMMLATNESLYPWMDEGFTSYFSSLTMAHLGDKTEDPLMGTYSGYNRFLKSGNAEAIITHADHFHTNSAYGVGSYVKGSIFLHQIRYIIGDKAFFSGMLKYYDEWRFKHPNPNDFIRIMELESDIELDWFKEYWVNSNNHPDYAISKVESIAKFSTKVYLGNVGLMPMPVDVVVNFQDGSTKTYNIPLRMMRGEKVGDKNIKRYEVLEDWPWTNAAYEFVIPKALEDIRTIEVSPGAGMFDTDKQNNVWPPRLENN